MKSFDTNVVVRLLVNDDPDQCERAGKAFREAVTEGRVFLSTTVLVEVTWVLRVSYKLNRATVTGALRRLIDAERVTVENEESVRRALDSFEAGAADFSDYIILESSRQVNALPVLTFDERFGREGDVVLVPPKQ